MGSRLFDDEYVMRSEAIRRLPASHSRRTSIACSSSSSGGRVGAMRILESPGSSLYGHVAPAPVIVTPASFANATVLLAVFGNPSKLTN